MEKDSHGAHQLVIPKERRIAVLEGVHDNLGHRRFYATRGNSNSAILVAKHQSRHCWFLRTCHICQIQQTQKALIPPVVATPAPLFAKVYMDTMHMPRSGGFSYVVQGRCSLIHYPEFRMLRAENLRP